LLFVGSYTFGNPGPSSTWGVDRGSSNRRLEKTDEVHKDTGGVLVVLKTVFEQAEVEFSFLPTSKVLGRADFREILMLLPPPDAKNQKIVAAI
jgi:hypothetical protein